MQLVSWNLEVDFSKSDMICINYRSSSYELKALFALSDISASICK